jgi:hypothetical protein
VGTDDLVAAVRAGVLSLAWFEALKRFKTRCAPGVAAPTPPG